MNSKLIDIEGTPNLPDIGYYNNNGLDTEMAKQDPLTTSYPALKANITKSCTGNNNSGIYTQEIINNNNLYTSYPNGYKNPYSNDETIQYDELNLPYYLYKSKIVNDDLANNKIETIGGVINKSSNDTNISDRIANQIKHLACQLVIARNRYYNPDEFPLSGNYSTVQSVFYNLGPSLVIPLIIVFFMTVYYLVSGLFSSMDLGANIINCVQKSKPSGLSYWCGIFIGLISFAIILITTYQNNVSVNLNQSEKDNITYNPYGVKNKINDSKKSIDYSILTIFILIIFGFVALLFTIKKESFNNYIYTGIVSFIMLIIATFIFMMYSYIPFFNTADQDKISSIMPERLNLFIDKSNDVSYIETNQDNDKNLKKNFLILSVVIFILSILFFKFGCKKNSESSFIKNIFTAITGASSILILPILWIFNFIIAIQYFYIYPIFLIILRFFRYLIMMFIYTSYKDSDKSNLSSDMRKILDNFKNYSPSWGLIGIEELKIIMGLNGYENIYSEYVINGSSNSVNLSDNKFVSSGLLGFFVQKNIKGIIFSSIYFIITFLITIIVLFGIVDIQKIYKI